MVTRPLLTVNLTNDSTTLSVLYKSMRLCSRERMMRGIHTRKPVRSFIKKCVNATANARSVATPRTRVQMIIA